jgi:hypothetical protein
MRRSLAIGTLTLSIVALTSGSALATGDDTGHGNGDGNGHGGRFEPIDPAFYDQVVEVPACGTTVTITAGDVRDVEERTRTLATGETLTEFRGGATLDLVRASDGARIDELDIGGPGFELSRTVGDEVRITNLLYGASIVATTGEPADIAGFEAAGVPLLGYFADPGQTVELELRIDAETGDLIETEFDEIDADIVDLCPLFV